MPAGASALAQDGLAEAAADAQLVIRVRGFIDWLGAGRKLTETGHLKLADARELVDLLGTDDEIDRVIGGQLFRTRSSQELGVLSMIVEWTRAAHLVRTVHGKLVPVKRSSRLLEKPLDLWMALFQAFPRMGDELLSTRWGTSLLGDVLPDAAPAVLTWLYDAQAPTSVAELTAMAWETVGERWRVDDLPEERRRKEVDTVERDLIVAMKTLQTLGAVAITGCRRFQASP
jgi:hypothetical protein